MSKQKPIVMAVEDEPLLLKAIAKKLESSNITAIWCLTGEQAFDYLQTNEELPDAIWLDFYLTDMEGDLFMKKLKANKKWANIPVIVVSNTASPDKVKTMLALGAKKYLVKAEHRLDEIVKVVQQIILSKENDREIKEKGNYG